jgi:2'-5' RNA ligase
MGILDDRITESIHEFREKMSALTGNDLALRFPVHITLRGPFWADTNIDALVKPLSTVRESRYRFRIVLDRPTFVNPDLLWLPVHPESGGASRLLEMHLFFEHELKGHIIKDDTSPGHFGINYRPHVTVGWGVTPSICREVSRFSCRDDLVGTLERVALASYPAEWPSEGMVEIASSIALNSA